MDNIQIKSALEYKWEHCCLDYLLSYCILRLETPHQIVTHNQSTVTNLEEAKYQFAYFVNFPPKKIVKGVRVGLMVPLRSVTFLDKKKQVIMVQKHKVSNIGTTLRHI